MSLTDPLSRLLQQNPKSSVGDAICDLSEEFDVPCLPECDEWARLENGECSVARSGLVTIGGVRKSWNVRSCHVYAAAKGSNGRPIVKDAFAVAIESVTGMRAIDDEEHIFDIRKRFLLKHGISGDSLGFYPVEAFYGRVKNGNLYMLRDNLRLWLSNKDWLCEVCRKLRNSTRKLYGMDLRIAKFFGMACSPCREALVQNAMEKKEWQHEEQQKLSAARKQLQQFNQLLKSRASPEASG